MFKQDAAAFPLEIRKYGCYFFCLLRMCELEAGKEISCDEVLDIFSTGKKNGTIAAKCSCVNPDAICRDVMKRLKCKKVIRQVGGINNEQKMSFWKWANMKPYNTPQYIALIFPIGGEIGTHYVLADAQFKILFDPSSHDYTARGMIGGLLHKVL